MNASLTVGALSFTQRYTDVSGSLRTEVSRGVNLPTEMTIKHQDIVDSTTKLATTRSVLRFDRYKAIADGRIIPCSAYLVVVTPKDVAFESTDVLAVVQSIVDTIQEDDSGLDLMDEIFVNKEQ
jgi:hypothetical protein